MRVLNIFPFVFLFSSASRFHHNEINEVNAIEEGKVDHANALLKTVERKKLLCTTFLSTDNSSISNLYSNVMLANDSCDWGLVFYRGNPEDVCNKSWLKPRLGLCTAHQRRQHYINKNVPKSVLYSNLLPALSKYERVFFIDEDISFKDFDVEKFLAVWSCAFSFQSPPLIVQPLIYEHTQAFNYVHSGNWAQFKEKGIVASSTRVIECQVPGFDSRFFEWYIKRVIGLVVTAEFTCEEDWGFGGHLWCSAAKSYAVEVLGWNINSTVCALLVGADPIHHLNKKTMIFRQIGENIPEFKKQTHLSLKLYRDTFPTWFIEDLFSPSPVNPEYWREFVQSWKVDQICAANSTHSA